MALSRKQQRTAAQTDLALGLISAAFLAALIAVSWRASPSRNDVVLGMYVVGGALELIGAVTVALDLRARRRRHRRFQSSASITFAARSRRMMPRASPPPMRNDPVARVAALERTLRDRLDELDQEAARRDGMFIRLIAPADSDTVAWVGFAALLAGVAIGTAANIVSAT